MEKRVNLSATEKELVLHSVDCQPSDAHRFCKYQSFAAIGYANKLGAWLECNRVAYNAMNACISLLNKVEGSKYPTLCPE